MSYRFFFDADEVLFKFTERILKKYNDEYGKNLTIDDLTEWELDQNINDGTSLSKYMFEDGFFESLDTYEGAEEVLKSLIDEGHEVYISTATWKGAILDKYASFEKHFPFLDFKNIIMVKDKFLLSGDFMLDDKKENIETSSARYPVIMDRPWNQGLEGLRVKNLTEFYELVQRIMKEENSSIKKRIG